MEEKKRERRHQSCREKINKEQLEESYKLINRIFIFRIYCSLKNVLNVN